MWPFTPSKTQIIKNLNATIHKATLDIKALANNLDTVRSELSLRTQHLHKRQDEVSTLAKRVTELLADLEGARHRIKCLVQELSNENTVCNVLRKDNKDKEAQILELTGFAEVLKSEIQAQKDQYAIDTHNLLLRIAELDPGTMSKAEPEAEPKPQLVQVTEDFFGKLAAELANQWTKTSTQSNGDAHGKVSDRLTSMQQFASTSNKSISNTASTKVSEAQVLTKVHQPVTEYIPSPDFAASFDEGATQVDGQSVATGISITQPASGPIKLPSQMVAEFEAPFNP